MSQLMQRGLPYIDGKDAAGQRDCKLVDPAEADAWRAANLTPKFRGGKLTGVATGSGGSDPNKPMDPLMASAVRIQDAKARRERIAEIRDLRRLQREEGKLVDRRAAIEVQEKFADAVASLIERMPADASTVLAAAVGCTEHKAYQALRAVAKRMREDLARTAEASADQARALGGSGTLGGDLEENEAA